MADTELDDALGSILDQANADLAEWASGEPGRFVARSTIGPPVVIASSTARDFLEIGEGDNVLEAALDCLDKLGFRRSIGEPISEAEFIKRYGGPFVETMQRETEPITLADVMATAPLFTPEGPEVA